MVRLVADRNVQAAVTKLGIVSDVAGVVRAQTPVVGVRVSGTAAWVRDASDVNHNRNENLIRNRNHVTESTQKKCK